MDQRKCPGPKWAGPAWASDPANGRTWPGPNGPGLKWAGPSQAQTGVICRFELGSRFEPDGYEHGWISVRFELCRLITSVMGLYVGFLDCLS